MEPLPHAEKKGWNNILITSNWASKIGSLLGAVQSPSLYVSFSFALQVQEMKTHTSPPHMAQVCVMIHPLKTTDIDP